MILCKTHAVGSLSITAGLMHYRLESEDYSMLRPKDWYLHAVSIVDASKLWYQQARSIVDISKLEQSQFQRNQSY